MAAVVEKQVGIHVVVEVFLRLVVEHEATQYNVGCAKPSEVRVLGSDGVVPLVVRRQVVQNVALVFGFVALEVEYAHVIGPKTKEGDLIFSVEFVLDFNLIVVVGRQEGKANNPKQVLQVATANAGEVGCLL